MVGKVNKASKPDFSTALEMTGGCGSSVLWPEGVASRGFGRRRMTDLFYNDVWIPDYKFRGPLPTTCRGRQGG